MTSISSEQGQIHVMHKNALVVSSMCILYWWYLRKPPVTPASGRRNACFLFAFCWKK